MSKQEQKDAYTRYLTERLDSGESKNIVISTTVDLIIQKAKESDRVRMLDVGCFSGAMLNRIRSEVPVEIRGRVEFVGVDIDEEALGLGRQKYSDLTLVRGEVLGTEFSDLGTFDILVMSNIIHEIIPDGTMVDKDRWAAVDPVISRAGDLLKPNGQLVILDGLRPDEDATEMRVMFSDSRASDLFELFAKEYHGFHIELTKLAENSYITRLKDLAAFLTKARYVGEKYWPIESSQIYQYFTAAQFIETLHAMGLITERLEPQEFDQEHLDSIFSQVESKVVMPAKNVLIVARKQVNSDR